MRNWGKDLTTWLDDRFGFAAIAEFLKNKPVPQHKHSIWLYTGSAILLFLFFSSLDKSVSICAA